MPFPAGIQTVTVTGSFGANAAVVNGTVDFTPATRVLYVGPKEILLPAKFVGRVTDGDLSIVLPCGGDPAGNPSGWTFHVTERVTGGDSYDILLLLANGPTQDLSVLAPVTSSTGTPVVVGPAGTTLTETPAGSGTYLIGA